MPQRRQQDWRSPDPKCLFVVACTGDLPSILDVVNSTSGGSVSRVGPTKEKAIEAPMEPGDGFGVITPERGLISVAVAGKPPPLPIMNQPAEWEEAGLNEELAHGSRTRITQSLSTSMILGRRSSKPFDRLQASPIAFRRSQPAA